MTNVQTQAPRFELAVWSRPDGAPLGKYFTRNENGGISSKIAGLNASCVERRTVESIADLRNLFERLPSGGPFVTSGLPPNGKSKVTVKDFPKRGHVTRTAEDISWRPGTGGYVPFDYDAKWSPFDYGDDEPLADLIARIQRAAALGGLDLSDTQLLTYYSSSSSIGIVGEDPQDNDGRHIILLVKDQSDIARFRDAMDVYLALSGSAYGGVSNAGTFLKRGIMDVAAIQPQQPTFVAPPAHGGGLFSQRDLEIVEGSRLYADTHELRDPTDDEIAQYEAFWISERERLRDECTKQRATWRERRMDELADDRSKVGLPELNRRQMRRIVDSRLGGNLYSDDVMTIDEHGTVTVGDVLANPEEFDGATGADPLEPEYGGSRNVAKVYLNRDSGRPQIFSQAHGGQTFRLWFDSDSALAHLDALPDSQRCDALEYVLRATRPESTAHVDSILSGAAKLTKGVTKKTLESEYRGALLAAMNLPDDIDEQRPTNQFADEWGPPINDLAFEAARSIRTERPIVSVGDQLWRYEGTHWRMLTALEAQQLAQRALARDGWNENDGSLTYKAKETVQALKQMSFALDSAIVRAPGAVMNLQNGELWFDDEGNAELRPHSPDSGLTYTLPVEYDPTATAPRFMRAIADMFMPDWRTWQHLPANGRKAARAEADDLRRHVLEQLAYVVVPLRWLTGWFFWKGPGSNGKTLLSDVLRSVMPPEAVEADDLLTISDSHFGLARLRGKGLLLDDDLATNVTLPDSFLKKLSEPKLISADVKHAPDSTSFENRAAVLVLGNNWPRIVDTSRGFVRRMHVTPFEREFLSQEKLDRMSGADRKAANRDLADPNLLVAIRRELPGIINELVAAYGRLRMRGGWAWPEPVRRATDEALTMGNPLPRFIDEVCSTGNASKYRYRRSEFHADFEMWLRQQNVHWSPSVQQIGEQMKQLGYTVSTMNGIEHYRGLMKGPGRPSLSIVDGGFSHEARKPPGDEPEGDEE